MTDPPAPLLIAEPAGRVTQLTLNRPEAMNALNVAMLDALIGAIESVDPTDTRCVVVTGAGPAFSAGADIKEELSFDAREFAALVARFARLATSLRRCPAPVVAAVNGYAIAGGFELAAQCDIRIVASGASLSVGDADVGLSPTSGLTWALPRLVGVGNALYLTLLSPRIDGEAAGRLGFAQEVVEPDRVLPRALEVAIEIASKPRLGVQRSKELFVGAGDSTLTAAIDRELEAELECFADPEVAAAFERFVDRGRNQRGGR